MKVIQIALPLALIFLCGCGSAFIRNKEAREDEQKMQSALDAQAQVEYSIHATAETDPIQGVTPTDDAADDPAIWYNSRSQSKSIIYGSNKKGGIHAYNLKGKELQFVACGKINNIDIRQNVDLGNGPVDIIVGSNRTGNSITVFPINEEGLIIESSRADLKLGKRFEPYGLCLYQGKENTLYVFVNAKTGQIDQYTLGQASNGDFIGQKVRSLNLSTQVEGMVADDHTYMLYVGEEEKAIFKFEAEPNASTKPTELNQSNAGQNKWIEYDIEGLALLTSKYLVASIQGSFSYAIFDLEKDRYLTSFKLTSANVDGVEETDGIDILISPMGNEYANGIMIVQDGFNSDANGVAENQNFKIIDVASIYSIIERLSDKSDY